MTRIAACYEEYAFFAELAWRAEKAGNHSDAAYYRKMAADAIAQLRREEKK